MTTPTLIGTTAAVRVAAQGPGHHYPMASKADDSTLSVWAAAVVASRTATEPAEAGNESAWKPPDEALMRATRTGWHELQAVRGTEPEVTMIVATWVCDTLTRPQSRGEGAGTGRSRTKLRWLVRHGASEDEMLVEDARELARYFILGLSSAGGTAVGRLLEERRADPYPDLSRLAIENERLLQQLSETPEELSADHTDEIKEIGRQVRKLLEVERF